MKEVIAEVIIAKVTGVEDSRFPKERSIGEVIPTKGYFFAGLSVVVPAVKQQPLPSSAPRAGRISIWKGSALADGKMLEQ